MEKIALVYMSDSRENFFIEDCPEGNPEDWIDRFVGNVEDVEHVIVHELGDITTSWTNPNTAPEDNDF